MNPNQNNQVQHQTSQQPEKWSCTACTYENWPKSNKCIMCGHQRERLSHQHQYQQHQQRERNNASNLILPSPERELRGLPSPPHTPYIHQAQRDENLAIARR